MDKKSILGILLIFGILVLFSVINQPSKEEVEKAKQVRDSIAQVELENATRLKFQEESLQTQKNEINEPLTDIIPQGEILKERENKFGAFGKASIGEEQFYTVESNLYKIIFSNKGGRIYSVELKGYQTNDSLPVVLFDGPETLFGLNFFAGNKIIQTDQLFFTPNISSEKVVVSGPEVKKGNKGKEKKNIENPGGSETISFKLELESGKYLEYVYTIRHNSYLVGFDVNMQGMNDVIASNISNINLTWSYDVPRQERISKWGEDRYTNLNYKFFEGEVEKLSQGKADQEDISTRTQWIGFKQLFFNSTIIANTYFPGAELKSEPYEDNQKYLANFYADIFIPFEGRQNENFGMKFYFGPNHYQTLKQYDIDLERLVYLGYAIVRPVNRYLIIPVFNFLRNYTNNFGLIILLLTIFIKTLVFPFTYKSYVSQAKMRALKPEIDEINEKFGKDKAMEKQQATMALYKKVGVSPMGGCLPMVFQMPILFAMFFFFPTSIELRHQSFLWASDLSTYDSILNLPFEIPMYGNHVSLFCLLMTVSTIISTKLNPQTAGSSSMPGMKSMMYIMPVMFLFILNSYPSGLSYYYLLANLFTIGQTYLVRRFVDEDKIRAQLLMNKKKPVKKSNFQAKLEQMAKQRTGHKPKKR